MPTGQSDMPMLLGEDYQISERSSGGAKSRLVKLKTISASAALLSGIQLPSSEVSPAAIDQPSGSTELPQALQIADAVSPL